MTSQCILPFQYFQRIIPCRKDAVADHFHISCFRMRKCCFCRMLFTLIQQIIINQKLQLGAVAFFIDS